MKFIHINRRKIIAIYITLTHIQKHNIRFDKMIKMYS